MAKHWTQQELAFAANLSVTHVNRIETSKTARPQMRSVKKLAAALCVEPAELLGEC
jgi:transcriptional regulator with XRE-family HTH domain